MPINYFGYSSVLSIYEKQLKINDGKDLLSIKFLDKFKKGCKKIMKTFRRSTAKNYWMNTTIVSFDPIYIRLALCQTSWE